MDCRARGRAFAARVRASAAHARSFVTQARPFGAQARSFAAQARPFAIRARGFEAQARAFVAPAGSYPTFGRERARITARGVQRPGPRAEERGRSESPSGRLKILDPLPLV